jgi:hypothetical protein
MPPKKKPVKEQAVTLHQPEITEEDIIQLQADIQDAERELKQDAAAAGLCRVYDQDLEETEINDPELDVALEQRAAIARSFYGAPHGSKTQQKIAADSNKALVQFCSLPCPETDKGNNTFQAFENKYELTFLPALDKLPEHLRDPLKRQINTERCIGRIHRRLSRLEDRAKQLVPLHGPSKLRHAKKPKAAASADGVAGVPAAAPAPPAEAMLTV